MRSCVGVRVIRRRTSESTLNSVDTTPMISPNRRWSRTGRSAAPTAAANTSGTMKGSARRMAGTGTLPRTSTITFESIVGMDMAITAVLGSTMSATIGTLIRGNPNPTNPFTKAAKTMARKTRTTCISIHPPRSGVGLAGR